MSRKRSNGDGYVKRLPSGGWFGQLMDGYQDSGKKKVVSFTGATKAEVLEKIHDYKSKRTILNIDGSKTSFSTMADEWYKTQQDDLQPSTYANYQYTLNVLKKHFGDTPIGKIKPMDINRFNAVLAQHAYSTSYIAKCRAMLIQIFDTAEANDLVLKNPARLAKTLKKRRALDHNGEELEVCKKDAFNDFERRMLFSHLDHDLLGNSIRLLLSSGMRIQELLGLFPEDIAEDGSTIHVSRAIETVNGIPVLGPTKSARGNRIIPIPPGYREYALYVRHHGGRKLIWSSRREDGLYSVGTFRKKYYKAISAIPGVRKLPPHCCRHTYISVLEKNGVPMEIIARLVGHSKITTTDLYLHTDINTLSDATLLLDAPMEGGDSK